MSMDALLQASCDQLRTYVGSKYNAPGGPPGDGLNTALTLQQCDVMYQGRPPESMGQWFISLYEAGIDSSERAMLKEQVSFDVFITVRSGVLPKDRWSAKGIGFTGSWQRTSMGALERWIIQALHGSQAVRIAANNYLGILSDGSMGSGYSIPPYYLGYQPTYDEDGTWIGAIPESAAFLVRRLRFGGALRVQSLDNNT